MVDTAGMAVDMGTVDTGTVGTAATRTVRGIMRASLTTAAAMDTPAIISGATALLTITPDGGMVTDTDGGMAMVTAGGTGMVGDTADTVGDGEIAALVTGADGAPAMSVQAELALRTTTPTP